MEITFDDGQPVKITVLNRFAPAAGGRLAALAGKDLQVDAEAPLSSGDLVKVEWGEYLLLGEVSKAQADGRATVEVEHVLAEAPQLERQKRAWVSVPG